VTTEVTTNDDLPGVVEQVLVGGDLSRLTPAQRVSYYNRVCNSMGLNTLTRPLEYITLNGKLTLYARKDCTDQLRKIHGVSITIQAREMFDDIYVVTARAMLPDGRTDESVGAVHLGSAKGSDKANQIMRAETKSKRRVTLSIVGLGMLDETEIETIPNAEVGEPKEQPKEQQRTLTDEELQNLAKAIDLAQSHRELNALGERCRMAPPKHQDALRKVYADALERIRRDQNAEGTEPKGGTDVS